MLVEVGVGHQGEGGELLVVVAQCVAAEVESTVKELGLLGGQVAGLVDSQSIRPAALHTYDAVRISLFATLGDQVRDTTKGPLRFHRVASSYMLGQVRNFF